MNKLISLEKSWSRVTTYMGLFSNHLVVGKLEFVFCMVINHAYQFVLFWWLWTNVWLVLTIPLQLWILILLVHSQCAMKHLSISRKVDREGAHLVVEQFWTLVLLCITQLLGIKSMFLQPRFVALFSRCYQYLTPVLISLQEFITVHISSSVSPSLGIWFWLW